MNSLPGAADIEYRIVAEGTRTFPSTFTWRIVGGVGPWEKEGRAARRMQPVRKKRNIISSEPYVYTPAWCFGSNNLRPQEFCLWMKRPPHFPCVFPAAQHGFQSAWLSLSPGKLGLRCNERASVRSLTWLKRAG